MRDTLELIIIYLLTGIFIIFSLSLLLEVETKTNSVIWCILTLLLAHTIIKRKD